MGASDVTDAIRAAGPWSIIAGVVVAIIRGQLVPFATHKAIVDDLRSDRDFWREQAHGVAHSATRSTDLAADLAADLATRRTLSRFDPSAPPRGDQTDGDD